MSVDSPTISNRSVWPIAAGRSRIAASPLCAVAVTFVERYGDALNVLMDKIQMYGLATTRQLEATVRIQCGVTSGQSQAGQTAPIMSVSRPGETKGMGET